MSDNDVVLAETGISRRDALKRGAVIGGAVLWVTPIVQNIAISPAGAQTPSPTFPSCSLSHFDLAVRRVGQSTVYGLLYDPGTGDFVGHNTSSDAHCLNLGTFVMAPADVVAAFNAVEVTNSSTAFSCCLRYDIPNNFEFVAGAAKCGSNCGAATLVPGTQNVYDFCCPL
jgi:hypothetical protein